MYGIYGNIYHQYTPNVSIYTSTMDPMGIEKKYQPYILVPARELCMLIVISYVIS